MTEYMREEERLTVDTPVIFTDGTEVYGQLEREYVRHERGLFILAPSGTGKTYYVQHQEEKHWVDGDYLWVVTGADPTPDEWDADLDLIHRVNRRCDVITEEAKGLGFWVLGSSNSSLPPDAIVLPPWDKHVAMIKHREDTHYDGGAKTADLEGIRAHRTWIEQWIPKGVPCFESIEEAVASLTQNGAQS